MAPIQLQLLLAEGVLAQAHAGVPARPYGYGELRDRDQVGVVQEDAHVAALLRLSWQDLGPTVRDIHVLLLLLLLVLEVVMVVVVVVVQEGGLLEDRLGAEIRSVVVGYLLCFGSC